MNTLEVFYVGKGINAVKLNYNFAELQSQINANETSINTIADTALRADGSNVTNALITKFKQDATTVLTSSGEISLDDGGDYFLTLTGNGTISLPPVANDEFSHTITMMVAGSEYTLDLGTEHHGLVGTIETTKPYSVMWVYNKLDKEWYYFLGQ